MSMYLGNTIRHRRTGRVLFRGRNHANVLVQAREEHADLSGADFRDTYLHGQTFDGLNLTGADFGRATLNYAGFHNVNLTRANFNHAVCDNAEFYKCIVEGTTFTRTSLNDARFSETDLRKASLEPIRKDLFRMLDRVPNEVPGLLRALRAGNMDGTAYAGPCACLVGTAAALQGVAYTGVPGLRPNASRPAERFFTCVAEDDTPRNSSPAKVVEQWIMQWKRERK